MTTITEISPERKQNARLLALTNVLSWAFAYGLLVWLSAPPDALRGIKPASIWLFLLVALVFGALFVLSIGETISRLDADHHGRRGLAGWIAAGLIGGLFSGLTNLPFLLNNEAGWASLVRNVLWFGGPLVGYALAFRRNPITTFAGLPPVETPTTTYRIAGGLFLVTGIFGLIFGAILVNGLLTDPSFRAPWIVIVILPISLAAIAFGYTFYTHKKPYDRQAVAIGCLGLLFASIGAIIGIAWLIWG